MAVVPAPAAASPVDYVIEISVDGLGSSYLEGMIAGNQLPNFARLQAESAWTLNARNDTDYTVTLPNHTTMLTGRAVVGPAGHNYTDDGTPAAGVTIHTNKGSYVASAFDVAHDNGLTTALFANKSKFSLYQVSYNAANGAPDVTGVDNGTAKIDNYYYTTKSANLAPAYVAAMTATPYPFSFLHLRDPDDVGHASGWGTPAYNDALRAIDGELGQVLDMVDTSPVLQGRTAVILTADHGGRGLDHSNVTEPLDYTIPLFIRAPGVTGNSDLYGLNAATRVDPATGRPLYSAPGQPIRNGDIANLGLSLLGLGPVPGSTINTRQDLAWQGSAPAPSILAHTVFNEPAANGASSWTPGAGNTELGFATTSTALGTTPLAATYSSTTSPLRFRVQSAEAATTFDAVNLGGVGQASAAIDIMLKNVTYGASDYFAVTLTNGAETITLAGAQGSALNTLARGPFLHYTAAIPDGWTTATLKIAAANDADTKAMDFDNIYFASLPAAPATLVWSGAADDRWNVNQSANWASGGWAWRYRDGDNVVFGDAAGGQPIQVDGTVAPGAVVFNSAADITLAGSGRITGSAGLTKVGPGRLTLLATVAVVNDLTLTADQGGEMQLSALDNSEGHKITKIGEGTVVLDGTQTYGLGSLLDVEGGTVDLNVDAGSDAAAYLSITVAAGTVHFGADQHLDTLTIGPGGTVAFTGAHVVVLNDLVMNGFDYGAATLTPEPATLALVAIGVWGLVLRRKRA
jgi:hypothetical protein